MHQLQNNNFIFQQNRVGATFIYNSNKKTQFQLGYIYNKQSTSAIHFITNTIIINL